MFEWNTVHHLQVQVSSMTVILRRDGTAGPSDNVLPVLLGLDNVATSRESELVRINRVAMTTCYGDGVQRVGQDLGMEVADCVSNQRQGVKACEASQGVGWPEIDVRCIQIKIKQCGRNRRHSLQVFRPHGQGQKSRQLREGLSELIRVL